MDYKRELKLLLTPNLLMPKLYSFDEVRGIVKEAKAQDRKQLVEEIEKCRLDCKTCGDWNKRIDKLLAHLKEKEK